jgi:hypothetical protein
MNLRMLDILRRFFGAPECTRPQPSGTRSFAILSRLWIRHSLHGNVFGSKVGKATRVFSTRRCQSGIATNLAQQIVLGLAVTRQEKSTG